MGWLELKICIEYLRVDENLQTQLYSCTVLVKHASGWNFSFLLQCTVIWFIIDKISKWILKKCCLCLKLKFLCDIHFYMLYCSVVWAGASSSPLRKGRTGCAKVEQCKSSPARSSHRLYLPASLGLHCIRDQSLPSIYTPLLRASRAPAVILYLMLPWIRTCSNNTGRFQNRSIMVDIYQTSLRAYLGLDSHILILRSKWFQINVPCHTPLINIGIVILLP